VKQKKNKSKNSNELPRIVAMMEGDEEVKDQDEPLEQEGAAAEAVGNI
jgi:hypothetical protein